MHRVQIQDSFESANGSVATRQLLQTQPAGNSRQPRQQDSPFNLARGSLREGRCQGLRKSPTTRPLTTSFPPLKNSQVEWRNQLGWWDLRGRRPGKHSHRPPVGRATTLAGQPNSSFALDIRGPSHGSHDWRAFRKSRAFRREREPKSLVSRHVRPIQDSIGKLAVSGHKSDMQTAEAFSGNPP